MILRRLALFVALLFGLGATQLPAFVQQYRQALGGAIGELETIVSAFESRSAQHGLSEAGGIDRLRANADPIARGEADQMEQNIARLGKLRDAQTTFKVEGPVARIATFAAHYDQQVARGAWRNFEPAIPASAEAFVLGVVGFLIGGVILQLLSRPFRRRRGKASQKVEAAA